MYSPRLRLNIAPAFVIAFLFATTSLFMPYIPGFRLNREALLGIMVMAGCAVIMARWTAAGACLLAYVALRFFAGAYRTIGSPVYLISMAAVLVTAGLFTYWRWGRARHGIYNAACLIALVNVGFEALQYTGTWWPRMPVNPGTREMTGLMSNPDEVAALLGICAPCFFRKGWVWLLPALLAGIAISKPLIGGAAIVAVAAVLTWKRYGLGAALACVIAGLSCLIGVAVALDWRWQSHLGHRLLVWWAVLDITLARPLFGYGFGTLKESLPAIADSVVGYPWREAHNDFVELAFCGGGAGIGLAGWFIYSTIRKGLAQSDIIPVLSFIAACVSALAFFTFQIVPLAILTLLSIVMIHGTRGMDGR